MTEDWRTYYYTIDSGLNTSFRLSFDRTGGSSDFDDINIDDIKIEQTPNCAAPANFNLSNSTGSSVDISWMASSSESNGYEWVIMDKHADVNPTLSVATGKVTTGITSTAVSGLTASTDYDFYIRTECTGGWSDFRGPYRFQTTCELESLPYQEDFEKGFPNCWSRSNEDQIQVISACANNNSQFIQLQGGEISYTTKAIDVSNESSIKVSWDIYNGCLDTAEAGEIFAVDYWDGSNWQNIVNHDPANLNANWTSESYDITTGLSQDFKLRFSRPSGNGSVAGEDDLSVDNLKVESNDINAEPFPSGSGTQNDPYEIATVGNLLYLANTDSTNGYFIQTADLDLNNINWNDYIDFSNSTYDGQGHIIQNLTLTSTFFMSPNNNSTLKNIGFENAIIDNSNLRGIFDSVLSSTIEKFYFDGQVGDQNSIFGFYFSSSSLQDSFIIMDEFANGIGNIFLYILGSSNISNSYFSSKASTSISTINLPSIFTNTYFNTDNFSSSGVGNVIPLSNTQMQQPSSFSGFDFNNIWYIDANENYGYPQLQTFIDIDHTFENGSWFPSAPPANNTSPVSVKVSDLNAEINDALMVSDLTVDAGADLIVKDVLKVEDTFNNQGNITFTSDSNGSGQFDTFDGKFFNNDNITVERYFSPTRAFRFATSSVTTSTSIYENWQENGNSPAGYGTHITGSQTGADGFDASQTGNPSMYGFDNTFNGTQNNAWFPIPNTDQTNLNAGDVYRIFIRGDRNYDLNSSPANPPNTATKLRATGYLHIGDYSPELSDISGYYSLVGNPYQAYVDFNQLNLSNVNPNFYWVWDPNLNTRGAYVTIDLNNGTSTGTSEAGQFIPPGQSFFIQTITNGQAFVGFKEVAKDVTATPVSVFSDENQASIDLLLYKTEALNASESEADALTINFSTNLSDEVNHNDAQKLGNIDENLAVKNGNHYLSIENRSLPDDEEQIELFVSGFTENQYSYKINLNSFPDHIQPMLLDNYMNESHLLNNGQNLINFNIDMAIPESSATNRFGLIFKQKTFSDTDFVAEEIIIYPNPVSNILKLKTKIGLAHDLDYQFYDLLGHKIDINRIENAEKAGLMEFNVSNLQSGVYFIEMQKNNQSIKKRFIKK